MEQDKYIWQHIVDHLVENVPVSDDPILEEWLATDDSNRLVFLKYKKIWDEVGKQRDRNKFDAASAWKKVNRINHGNDRFRRRLKNVIYVTSGMAASIILFVSLWYGGFFEQKAASVSMEVKTAYGSRSNVVLPDGSEVVLNAGSQLNYRFNGEAGIREVYFNGEGFFQVSKSDAPFLITTSPEMQIRVLGTIFNLSAYEDDSTVIASLVDGQLVMENHVQTLNLNTGQIALYDKAADTLTYIDGELAYMYGWLQNKLYMENMSLYEVCKRLERWYDVQITLEDDIGEKIHYSGVLKEKTIMDVLNSLSKLSKIKYTIVEKDIIISPKK